MTTRIKKDFDRLMGNNLKRVRVERGWSQEKLAEMIDTDRRYISAVENGRGNVKRYDCYFVCAFGCALS